MVAIFLELHAAVEPGEVPAELLAKLQEFGYRMVEENRTADVRKLKVYVRELPPKLLA